MMSAGQHLLHPFGDSAHTPMPALSALCAFLDVPGPGKAICFEEGSACFMVSRPLLVLARQPNHALDDRCILAAEHLPHLHHLQRLRNDKLGCTRLQRLICAMLHLDARHGNGRLQSTAQQLNAWRVPV